MLVRASKVLSQTGQVRFSRDSARLRACMRHSCEQKTHRGRSGTDGRREERPLISGTHCPPRRANRSSHDHQARTEPPQAWRRRSAQPFVRTAKDVSGYDAVVLGGSLYAGHWHHGARLCVKRNVDALSHRPVWLFSSGPVDSSADQQDIPPTRGVAKQMERLHAREHVTFGGSITASTPGRIARYLVRHGEGGDFRNPERIQNWAHHIGAELAAHP